MPPPPPRSTKPANSEPPRRQIRLSPSLHRITLFPRLKTLGRCRPFRSRRTGGHYRGSRQARPGQRMYPRCGLDERSQRTMPPRPAGNDLHRAETATGIGRAPLVDGQQGFQLGGVGDADQSGLPDLASHYVDALSLQAVAFLTHRIKGFHHRQGFTSLALPASQARSFGVSMPFAVK